MKLLALLPLAVLAADVVVASAVPARHHRIARRLTRKKRCLARSHNTLANSHSPSTSPPITYPALTPQQQATTTTSTPDPPPPTSSPPTYNQPQTQSGVINVASTCGDIGATPNPTKESGPNGSIQWLNCGIKGSGWNPPKFSVNQAIAKDLNDVLSTPGNPYEACRPHLDAFYKASSQYNLPPILIAAISMQESSCNANTIGANGEQGLMQITPDKCPGGYASDGCREPYTNINIGARYLSDTINSCGGNLPQAIGTYNGWQLGMTEGDATLARAKGMCFAQNNLDYIHQTVNGWMQGVDPRAQGMGVFFNLDGC